MDSQIVEILGRNQLVGELLRAGLEVSVPVRDRGIDVIAYADLFTTVPAFVARPIQMKASSNRSFGLDRKYARFPNLLIAYVWHLDRSEDVVTFALTYDEACRVLQEMGYANTTSWERGNYVNNEPGVELRRLLEPYRMTPGKWRERITQGT